MVEILLITHGNVGETLLEAAKYTLNQLPLDCSFVSIDSKTNFDKLRKQLEATVKKSDNSDGLLVLTDLYGSTPCNIINNLSNHHPVEIVTGLNLAMIIKVMNYASLPLKQLADKAVLGGRESIINCNKDCHDKKENYHH